MKDSGNRKYRRQQNMDKNACEIDLEIKIIDLTITKVHYPHMLLARAS